MRTSRQLLTLVAPLLIFACDDDPVVDDHSGGNEQCLELGEYCHEAGEIDAAAQECHEFMHVGADGCLDRYDECQMICQSVLEGAGGGAAGSDGAAAGAGGHAGAG